MNQSAPHQPVWHKLSGQDVSYLKFETEERPMHFGAIARFSAVDLPNSPNEPPHERVRSLVVRRALSVPILSTKLAFSPLSQWPHWVSANDEDVEGCVQIEEPGTSEEHLVAVARRAMSTPLPRDKPLWRVLVIPPADGETGFGIVFLVHHSLVDGIAGLVVLAQILDHPPRPDPLRRHTRPSLLTGVARDLAGFAALPFNALRALANTTLSGQLRALWRTSRALLTPGRRTQIGNGGPMARHVFHFSIPRMKVRATSRALGVTPNDLVLATSAEAVRALVSDSTGDSQRSRVAMPVSLRDHRAPATIGNCTGLLMVSAEGGEPSDANNVRDLSREVHRRLKEGDPRGYQALCELTASLGRWTQTALHRLTGKLGSYDILVTSLVGTSQRLTLDGARMDWLCPMAQLFSNQVVSLAIAAYDGQYHFGVLATDSVAGETFTNALERTLAELVATNEADARETVA